MTQIPIKNTTNTSPPVRLEARREIDDGSAVQKYYSENGEMCYTCKFYVSEPDINFYGCKILMGDYPLDLAPCTT